MQSARGDGRSGAFLALDRGSRHWRERRSTSSAAAADAALRAARPLSQNAYKIQVAKTAVKRAILRAAGIQTV